MTRVASGKPDGSIFYATTPTYILTSLLSKPANTYRDLEPVVNFFTDAGFPYTRADGPYKTLKDVIDHAKAGRGRWGVSNPASLEREAAERLKAAAKVNAYKRAGKFQEALETIAGLRKVVDQFFDGVMVMAENEGVRANRLALLAELLREFTTVADFSEIGGEERR